jgi:hypothetical protein
MPTAEDLANQVEQLDDVRWHDFLDLLDEVARRRRERKNSEPDEPEGNSRDQVAAWLAEKDLIVDSSIREVWYLPEGAPDDEIRFLEINDRFPGSENEIEPFQSFVDITTPSYRVFTIYATSKQLDQIMKDPALLPAGWSLDGRQVRKRRP